MISAVTGAKAQDTYEAINLSNTSTNGTARSMAFGGALGSIGGDFGSASVNPAGMGVYRSSELTFTPTLRINSSNTQAFGTETSDGNTRFNVANFGLVFTDAPKGKRYERRKWKTVTFGFGLNKTADYNRNFSYNATTQNNSITNIFALMANNNPSSATGNFASSDPANLAYNTYAINDSIKSGGTVFSSALPSSAVTNQNLSVLERGRISEWVLSLAGNYREKLMLGATLGLPGFRYTYNSTYNEGLSGSVSSNPYNFKSLTYTENLTLKGNGANLKLGAIFKLDNSFRIGAAFHTPTIYAIEDQYTPGMYSEIGGRLNEATTNNGFVASGVFNYQFVTPWRSILSASYILKGKGFLTADFEYVGYNSMQYLYPVDDGTGYSYATEQSAKNSLLRNMYQNTSNIRIGGELILTKYIMARAGFSMYGNPYKQSSYGQRTNASVGLGFRDEYFFLDFAYLYTYYQQGFQTYLPISDFAATLSGAPAASTTYAMNTFALTVGFKF